MVKGGLREVGGSIPEGVTPLVHTVTDPSMAHCAAEAIDQRSALAAHSEKEFPFFHHNLEIFILFNEGWGEWCAGATWQFYHFFFGMTLLETMNKV